MQTEGETRRGRVLPRRPGIPFSLSTLGTASIEDVAAAAPQGRKWFQLYMWRTGSGRWRWSPGGRGRVRHPAGHGRRPGRRRATAGCPQWDVDPAGADAADRVRRGPAARAGGSTS